MKYNDIAVTKSSWEELVRDSFGGYRNASAYCLMYINDKAQFLIQGKMMHHHHYYCLEVIYLLFVCMSVLPACNKSALYKKSLVPVCPPEDQSGSLRTGVTDCYREPVYGCWGLYPCPQEQQVLLTAKPGLQPQSDGLLNKDFSVCM